MAQISRQAVLHLAQLSRLQLDDSEVDALTADLTNILGYVEQLDELDTETVEPTYQVTGLSSIWRDDTIVTSDVTSSELLALAPEMVDNQVKVPKVL